jgi:hypothetical protein
LAARRSVAAKALRRRGADEIGEHATDSRAMTPVNPPADRAPSMRRRTKSSISSPNWARKECG